ncbi:hypothetical protein [Deinococcus sp. Marseille-Q6407]|uniref:hypothetical protein n=1 Tax=Deinococcus sp. Marseille-Q6407 TaxID=2969223 RepID=UPI0021C17863|nr:hypothetical protein [Deinococcus sp. Marseille-Q6407]
MKCPSDLFARLLFLAGAALFPQAQALSPQVAPFVPAGYSVIQGKAVDLDGDGRPDRVLALEDTRSEQGDRILLLLRGTPAGFRLWAQAAPDVLLCRQCGGAWGDPLDSLQAGRGWLRVNHYGGSRWRWSISQTFGLQQGRWRLTGFQRTSFDALGTSETSVQVPPAECQNTELSQLVCGLPVTGAGQWRVRSPRAFFYRSPSSAARAGQYVVAGQRVNVYRRYRTFAEAEFVPGNGPSTIGFLRLSDLTP